MGACPLSCFLKKLKRFRNLGSQDNNKARKDGQIILKRMHACMHAKTPRHSLILLGGYLMEEAVVLSSDETAFQVDPAAYRRKAPVQVFADRGVAGRAVIR